MIPDCFIITAAFRNGDSLVHVSRHSNAGVGEAFALWGAKIRQTVNNRSSIAELETDEDRRRFQVAISGERMPSQGLKDSFLRDHFLTRSNLIELALGVVAIAGLETVFNSFTKDTFVPIFTFIGGAPDFSAIKPFGIEIENFITTLLSFLIRISILYLMVVFPPSYFARKRSSEE